LYETPSEAIGDTHVIKSLLWEIKFFLVYCPHTRMDLWMEEEKEGKRVVVRVMLCTM
jgi:hypothetical protein